MWQKNKLKREDEKCLTMIPKLNLCGICGPGDEFVSCENVSINAGSVAGENTKIKKLEMIS